MQQVIQQLRRASAGLATDNRAAAFKHRANVLLVRDTEDSREYPADFFISLENESAADAAKRIASRILKGWNRLGITRVAVIQNGSDVSRIVELCDPHNVEFSAEFTSREKPAAVPDLLSALESLYTIGDSSLDYRPEFRKAIANAHAVIVKAKGGAA